MWVIHNCLPWGSACQVRSWADLAELLVFLAAACVAVVFALLGLCALGEWLL